MIDIHTSTIGREFYLKRQINSLIRNCGDSRFSHHILFQKESASEDFIHYWHELPSWYKERSKIYSQNYVRSVGETVEFFKDKFQYDLILKLDDDAKILSDNFITNALAIHKIYDKAVFSPFPVGLINNLGGVPSSDRHVVYDNWTDTNYTFRKVPHIGGFARFSPKKYIIECDFGKKGHTEDSDFSAYCNNNGIDRYYLENDLVVEHQESTLGQHARLSESYFQGRF